jgi:hypothetical protein
MSLLPQDPEGLSPIHLALVTVVSLVIGALAVGAAALLTPRALLRAEPRGDPRTPVAAVARSSIRGRARGLEQRREARQRLDTYGWVDREAGVARIPIERAMELVARGVRPPEAGAPPAREGAP